MMKTYEILFKISSKMFAPWQAQRNGATCMKQLNSAHLRAIVYLLLEVGS